MRKRIEGVVNDQAEMIEAVYRYLKPSTRSNSARSRSPSSSTPRCRTARRPSPAANVAAGAGIPLAHSHDGFEETIYGLEGVTTFTLDGEAINIGRGDTLCIKRGQVHSFMAGDSDASFLGIATPGVFAREYFLEIADMIAASDGLPDPHAMAAVMLRHGLTPVPA